MEPTSPPDAKPAMSAREQINARRRRHALIQAIMLVSCVIGTWCSVVFLNDPGKGVLSIVAMAYFMAVLLYRLDVCPSCEQNISMLPHEGHLRLPELSRDIRCCPYCAADFSYSEKQAGAQNQTSATLINL